MWAVRWQVRILIFLVLHIAPALSLTELVQNTCMMLEPENQFYNYKSQIKKSYLLMQNNRNIFSIYNDPSNLNRT